MRIFIYTIIVFIIQCLSRILFKLYPLDNRWTVPQNLCYSPLETCEVNGDCVYMVCCDCGAGHYLFMANGGLYGIPCRPEGYNYKFRLNSNACYADEKAKKLWNFRRYTKTGETINNAQPD
jgi:hypothetical protein